MRNILIGISASVVLVIGLGVAYIAPPVMAESANAEARAKVDNAYQFIMYCGEKAVEDRVVTMESGMIRDYRTGKPIFLNGTYIAVPCPAWRWQQYLQTGQ